MKFQNKLALEKVWGFARRNSLWIALIAAVAVAMNFSHEVINTAMLIVLFEAIALGLSGFAAFVYTKVDFTRTQMWNTLGSIFLGVHICIGLAVMGVYFTQV
jgi:hypothetical protein